MAAKTTSVTLAHKVGSVVHKREFDFEHAQRILDLPKNGGWYLADERFELSEDGTIVRRNKKKDKQTAKGQ